jgi:hypothetical protein
VERRRKRGRIRNLFACFFITRLQLEIDFGQETSHSSKLELDLRLQLQLAPDLAMHAKLQTNSACTCHACNMQLCNLCNFMKLYATRLLQLDLLQLEFNNSFNLTLIHGNSNFFMVDSVIRANALEKYIYIICNIKKIVCF